MKTALLLLCLALGLPAAAQDAVPVDGHARDIAALEGRWSGGYASEATGRTGSLSFTLLPGETHGAARLVMLPRPTPEAPTPDAVVLALRIVEVDGDRIRGALAPYADPEWDLPLDTHFEGTLTADRLEGTFLSLPTTIDSIPSDGRWWAVREAAPSL